MDEAANAAINPKARQITQSKIVPTKIPKTANSKKDTSKKDALPFFAQ